MVGIDLTCFGKEEILNENIVSGIGTWISEILEYIICSKKQNEYVLIVDFYSEIYIKSRFPGFKVYSLGGYFSKQILKFTGKSTEKFLRKCGFNRKTVDEISEINTLWFPFGIPEIVYWSKKTVLTIHDFMRCNTKKERNAYEKMLKKSDAVVVISNYVRSDLESKFPMYIGKVVATIPNSIHIDLTELKPLESMHFPIILDINRYERHKNAHSLLKAFVCYLKDYHGDADLAFVGYGNEAYLRELKDYAIESGIIDRVHFFWKLPMAEKNWLLKNASLFVSPSVNEGMGRTPVEAMIAGIPTLTTRETSLYEATLGLATYCNDPYDVNEMAAKINKLLSNGLNSSEKYRVSQILSQEYSVDNIWEKYIQVFSKL